jgi:predicted exporter
MIYRGLPISIIAISALTMTQVEYNDDIHQLQAMPADLKKQENTIADVTGIQSSQQMLLVSARSDEELLVSLENMDTILANWQTQGLITEYQGLHQYVSSITRQRENFGLIEALYRDHAEQLASSLQLADIPIFEQTFVSNPLINYLANPVSEPIRFLYLDRIVQGQLDDQVHSIVLLKGVDESLNLSGYANSTEDVHYLNKVEQISTLFASYRIKIMELLGIAILLIASLLSLRYGTKQSIKILMPSLIACVAGLAITVITGSTLNLFNLLALILIIGIGIDYTLFFSEQNQSHSTLLAISLSAMTTLLSFGLLALSNTHAIHSFGITVLAGIFVAWLLAPMASKQHHKEQV